MFYRIKIKNMLVEIIISLVLPCFISCIITYVGKRKMPPGPFPLPLIGNTLEMLRDPHNPFEKLAKKYSYIFTTQLVLKLS